MNQCTVFGLLFCGGESYLNECVVLSVKISLPSNHFLAKCQRIASRSLKVLLGILALNTKLKYYHKKQMPSSHAQINFLLPHVSVAKLYTNTKLKNLVMHKKVEKLKIMIWHIFADGTKVKIPFEIKPPRI